MTRRGSLIVIEGNDRTGKSTQCALLISRLELEGRKVQLFKLPDRTTLIGKLINSYLVDKSFELSDESIHLLFSANRWELLEQIKKLLLDGVIVILDRYVYSGVAYSAAKGLSFDWCLNPDRGLPKPDLVLFLTLENDQDITKREGYGEERYEVKSFQDKVKAQFSKFFTQDNWQLIKVDGKNIEQVSEDVWNHVQTLSQGNDLVLETI